MKEKTGNALFYLISLIIMILLMFYFSSCESKSGQRMQKLNDPNNYSVGVVLSIKNGDENTQPIARVKLINERIVVNQKWGLGLYFIPGDTIMIYTGDIHIKSKRK